MEARKRIDCTLKLWVFLALSNCLHRSIDAIRRELILDGHPLEVDTVERSLRELDADRVVEYTAYGWRRLRLDEVAA